MRENRKLLYWALLYGGMLAAFTLYVLMDAFVIVRSYATVEAEPFAPRVAEAPLSAQPAETPAQDAAAISTETPLLTASSAPGPVITDTSYEDGSVTVRLSELRACDSTVHVAEVILSDAWHLKTALAQNTYGRNVTERTSDMAAAQGAVLAINGDYYGAQRSGYVVRNGVLYRDTSAGASQEDLCVWPDGSLSVIREGDVDAQALVDQGVLQVFSFGPALVEEGRISVTREEEVGNAMTNNPRTAIAMIEPLHYLFVVADGRTRESSGLSLYQLADVLLGLGARVAYNLDGGGSSTMVFMGEVVNFPTTRGSYSERAVSDIVYVN